MSAFGHEQWRQVPGFPGYLVSNLGRVHSGRTNKCLKPQPCGSGHQRVSLRRNDKTHPRLLHRLVLLAFSGKCPEGQEGLHWDDDPLNNKLSNLRWGTRKENRADAVRNQRARGGRKKGQALTREQASSIKRYLRAGATKTRLAALFKVSRTTIAKIEDGTLWKDVV
jgi:hypothetical protein